MAIPVDKVESLRRRFERKIWKDLATGCWNWQAGKDGRGYPRIRFGDKILYAYHAAVFLYRQVPLDADVRMSMKCKNQLCVNPEHVEVK